MESNTAYLKNYNTEISKISQDTGVDKEEIIFVIDQYFRDMRSALIDPRLPKIIIRNLGTFKPTIGKIGWHIKNCIYKMENGLGDPEILQKRIDKLNPILERLMEEKAGLPTWRKWRDIGKEAAKKKKNEKKAKKSSPQRKSSKRDDSSD